MTERKLGKTFYMINVLWVGERLIYFQGLFFKGGGRRGFMEASGLHVDAFLIVKEQSLYLSSKKNCSAEK